MSFLDETNGYTYKTGHPNVNIKVVFLPSNTTSVIQPLDRRIIAAFKRHYVKLTFRYILEKLENNAITLGEVWKRFSILHCINHAPAGITEMKPTLNTWRKAAWPECVARRSAAENTLMLTTEIVTMASAETGLILSFEICCELEHTCFEIELKNFDLKVD
uniref:DDE-1 domain-containing protein n=1 Tax=Glossina austeni TaxID=7395 RepID=A0A1A9VNY9_GLOAU